MLVTVATENGLSRKKLCLGKAFLAEVCGLGPPNFTLILLLGLILLTPCCCCKHHEKCEDVSLKGGYGRNGELPWCTVLSYAAQDLSAEVETASMVRQRPRALESPMTQHIEQHRRALLGAQPECTRRMDTTYLTRETQMAHLVSVKALRVIP